ncbi:hypothetical protein [Helicobacter sp. 13S00477-4]|uniref:hypothetical protein n=1 Tax=Helicobacter sp. 13S00477-4 TaxID=1905759 RepID=UPI000BD8F9A8|nr:hypothetical protein [Helicobacter sp. 13S00477-4]PAF52143.1 hypothetical protein BKH44_03310 [Helicobacter sp. 13S00477-4]
MKKISIIFLITISNLYSDMVRVDEMFTQKSSLRLEASIFYANIQRQNNVIAPVIIGSGIGSSPIFAIPAILNTQKANQDYLNFGLNLRYGITRDIEIFAAPSFFYQHTNISDIGFSHQDDYNFNNFNMGFVYQVKKENKYPSLLVGATPIVIEKSLFDDKNTKSKMGNIDYFKSYSIFATSYYTVDPVIFLLQGGVRFSLKRKFDGHSLKIGDVLNLSPMVYFALNPYTSINFGVRYEYKFKDRLDNKVVVHQGSSIAYLFGVSYEINPALMVSIDINSLDTNLYASNSVNVLFSYRLK